MPGREAFGRKDGDIVKMHRFSRARFPPPIPLWVPPHYRREISSSSSVLFSFLLLRLHCHYISLVWFPGPK